MLFDLESREEFHDGPWFDKYNLFDENSAESLLDVVEDFVYWKSYPLRTKNAPHQRFYTPDYRGYPTAEDVYQYLTKTPSIGDGSASASLYLSHVQRSLDVLCLSGSRGRARSPRFHRSTLRTMSGIQILIR